jgi:FKBP-type peptidyl-prolyl cis-trans isomerase
VSSRNRAKRIQNRQARESAVEEARRRARRRRWEIASGGVVLALVIGIAFAVRSNLPDKSSTSTTTTTIGATTTTTAALPSAKGKPCVALNDTLPKGAPSVPVKVGPPPTSLVKEDLKVGTGAVVKPGATVTVNYIGVSCSTGKIFDSSYKTGQPATFGLDQVIKGWTDGIPGMKVGGERLLGIPSAQAYGAAGRAPSIAPDEPLWFVVSLISAK